jgi:hypothetical protein
MDLDYWEQYYEKHPEAFEPSDFAKFVTKYINEGDYLIDLGCGNARDSIFFSTVGIDILGVDQCINQINRLERMHGNASLHFEAGNFTELNGMVVDHAYSRFTLHSIDEQSEDKLIEWASKWVDKYFFIETRSDKDKLNGVTTDHYRRFINMNTLIQKLITAGFEIEYAELSRNFSRYDTKYGVDYNEDDPMLIRIAARKQ